MLSLPVGEPWGVRFPGVSGAQNKKEGARKKLRKGGSRLFKGGIDRGKDFDAISC